MRKAGLFICRVSNCTGVYTIPLYWNGTYWCYFSVAEGHCFDAAFKIRLSCFDDDRFRIIKVVRRLNIKRLEYEIERMRYISVGTNYNKDS